MEVSSELAKILARRRERSESSLDAPDDEKKNLSSPRQLELNVDEDPRYSVEIKSNSRLNGASSRRRTSASWIKPNNSHSSSGQIETRLKLDENDINHNIPDDIRQSRISVPTYVDAPNEPIEVESQPIITNEGSNTKRLSPAIAMKRSQLTINTQMDLHDHFYETQHERESIQNIKFSNFEPNMDVEPVDEQRTKINASKSYDTSIEDESIPIDSNNLGILPNKMNSFRPSSPKSQIDSSYDSSDIDPKSVGLSIDTIGSRYEDISANSSIHTLESVSNRLHFLLKPLAIPRGTLPVTATINFLTGNLIIACNQEKKPCNRSSTHLLEIKSTAYGVKVLKSVRVHTLELEKKCAQLDLCSGGNIYNVKLLHLLSGLKRLCVVAMLKFIKADEIFNIPVILVYSWPAVLQTVVNLPSTFIESTICVSDAIVFVASSDNKVYAAKLPSGVFVPVLTCDQKICSLCMDYSLKMLIIGCAHEVLLFSYSAFNKKKERLLTLLNRFALSGTCKQVVIHPFHPILCTLTTIGISVFNLNANEQTPLATFDFPNDGVQLQWFEDDEILLLMMSSNAKFNVFEVCQIKSVNGLHKCEIKEIYSENHEKGKLHMLQRLFFQSHKTFFWGELAKGFDEETAVSVLDTKTATVNAVTRLSDEGSLVDENASTLHVLSCFDVEVCSSRYWLCMTSCKPNLSRNGTGWEEGNEVEYGGANMMLLAELKFPDSITSFVPCRIRRTANVVAIIMKANDLLSEPSKFIIYDINKRERVCSKFSARDVAFIDENNLLVLSESGENVCSYNLLSQSESNSMDICQNGLLGKQIFYINRKIYIIASNGSQECLIRGYNGSSDSVVLFDTGEVVLNVIHLSNEHTTNNIAVATNKRVSILSDDLERLNEYFCLIRCPTLYPLGSNCVAFLDFSGTGPSLRYISTLDSDKFSSNIICNIPQSTYQQQPSSRQLLVNILPDRFIYLRSSICSLRRKNSQDSHVLFPMPITHPLASLLEPLVSNALCKEDDQLLRKVIDRFGRKTTNLPHMENEGIGCSAIGLTDVVLDMLIWKRKHYAAELLFKGTNKSPVWLPLSARTKMNEISAGFDITSKTLGAYTSQRVGNLATFSEAVKLLHKGRVSHAVELLKMSNSEESDRLLLELALNGDNLPMKKLIGLISAKDNSTGTIAIIMNGVKFDEKISVQDGNDSTDYAKIKMLLHQSRRQINNVHSNNISNFPEDNLGRLDSVWDNPLNDKNHVWNNGAFKEQGHFLALDRFDDWLGRYRHPLVSKNVYNGEQTLRDLLEASHDDETGNMPKTKPSGPQQSIGQWVEGIGEGRNDDDFICAYFRFSEGSDDENNDWQTNGVSDLSPHNHQAILYGSEALNLEISSCGVDEGEIGKVKQPYDLVFEPCDRDITRGMVIEVSRGDSLDIGVLHEIQHEGRRKCTIEMWFYAENRHTFDQVILMRRALASKGSDLSKLCAPSYALDILWEIALDNTGHLQFRTPTTTLSSVDFLQDSEGNTEEAVLWQSNEGPSGWNHIAVVLVSDSNEDIGLGHVKVYIKGETVISGDVTFLHPAENNIDDFMDNSALIFGLCAFPSFRMTELRIWSCERNQDDIKRTMYEYLSLAEQKSKFRFRIKNKGKGKAAGKALKLNLSTRLQSLKPRNEVIENDIPSPISEKHSNTFEDEFQENPLKGDVDLFAVSHMKTDFNAPEHLNTFSAFEDPINEAKATDTNIFGAFDSASNKQMFDWEQGMFDKETLEFKPSTTADKVEDDTTPATQTNWSTQILSTKEKGTLEASSDHHLSEKVLEINFSNDEDDDKSSINLETSSTMEYLTYEMKNPISSEIGIPAASAVLRGPPATRHFGGNNGGLVEEEDGQSTGTITVCGLEKTIIYNAMREQDVRTFQFGASGAIMQSFRGIEYMCCFTAGENLLTVINLEEQKVLASQQITTKLNFWRCLPPQTHGGKLTFMLATPAGGFHWMPLEADSRPRRMWKRGSNLEGKRIIAYEEGGNNGYMSSKQSRSTVCLILASSKDSIQAKVEVWCIPIGIGGSTSVATCVSSSVLGAAFYRPPTLGTDGSPFKPLLCLVTEIENADCLSFNISLHKLSKKPLSTPDEPVAIILDGIISSIDYSLSKSTEIPYPKHLVMGELPHALVLCKAGYIVVILRNHGVVIVYSFLEGCISQVGHSFLNTFIVDATLRFADTEKDDLVLTVLLASPGDTSKSDDANLCVVPISRKGDF